MSSIKRPSSVPLLFLLFLCGSGRALHSAAEGDYPAIFGADYGAAQDFVQNEQWLRPLLAGHGLDPDWALAIVFPELIRYSRLVDAIQTRTLEVLYVQYGRRYADFSIGRFQIKPSFAERLESDGARLLPQDEFRRIFPAAAEPTPERERAGRLRRLGDLRWNARYLALFIAVMERLYGGDAARFAGPEEKLRFYATAYNCGYWRGETVIGRETGRRRFHLELLAPKVRYSYADIACDFWLRTRQKSGLDGRESFR